MSAVVRSNLRGLSILRATGLVQLLTSLMVVPALLVSIAEQDGLSSEIGEVLLLMSSIGLLLYLPTRHAHADLRMRDGFLVTTLVWVFTGINCALPMILAPPYLSFTDAVFESVSGLTTTGATVIVGIDALPNSIKLYRQMLCFYGGMGIVVLAVAILPTLRIGGMQLTKGETSGPIKDSKLTPRIAQTAAALWLVYCGLVLLCALCFWMAGMTLFDAFCHAFSTLSTAGFSTHDASFAYFDSPLIEMIAIIFMILGGTNFALHYLAWQRGSLRAYWRDTEFRSFVLIVLGCTAFIAISGLLLQAFTGPVEALRLSAFHLVSNITTTGFTTTGFAAWPGHLPLFLLLVGFVGACAGSTTGGLKTIRILIIFKQAAREVLRVIHPRAQFLIRVDRRSVSETTLDAVAGYVTLYMSCFVLLSLVVLATGESLTTSFSAIAASINNLGPGLDGVATNFRDLNNVATWAATIAMLVGRLEIFTVLVLLTPAYWRE